MCFWLFPGSPPFPPPPRPPPLFFFSFPLAIWLECDGCLAQGARGLGVNLWSLSWTASYQCLIDCFIRIFKGWQFYVLKSQENWTHKIYWYKNCVIVYDFRTHLLLSVCMLFEWELYQKEQSRWRLVTFSAGEQLVFTGQPNWELC